jgi:hypothetical protein
MSVSHIDRRLVVADVRDDEHAHGQYGDSPQMLAGGGQWGSGVIFLDGSGGVTDSATLVVLVTSRQGGHP